MYSACWLHGWCLHAKYTCIACMLDQYVGLITQFGALISILGGTSVTSGPTRRKGGVPILLSGINFFGKTFANLLPISAMSWN